MSGRSDIEGKRSNGRGHESPDRGGRDFPKIRVSYTQIVTISTDNILKANDFRDWVGAQWTFLSDAGRTIQKDLGIQEYTDS